MGQDQKAVVDERPWVRGFAGLEKGADMILEDAKAALAATA
jgi:hypothetical protein